MAHASANQTNSFNTILIANRGEIACRIARSAQSMGYRTVAVYSDADADAPHVHIADDAAAIGPPPPAQSYLAIENLIAAAKSSGAEAIHPGYGFLSENPDFAEACADAGLVFIGPPPDAIRLMGNKAAAKRHMLEAGVPCVPGYSGGDQSNAGLLREAADIGFPIMVKAAAGGGGRGMRLVEDTGQMETALNSARSEAENAFGSGELILEKAILQPRHIEIQVLADAHGNVVHLGERDCSIQRRHQKIVEEAPSPAISGTLRDAMGETAIAAAKSIGYVGAGTVEFLTDDKNNYYFLEMNTRLQVEHPVTEMITGHDLVALQINIAAGAALPFRQQDVSLHGHAIEVRLYAEDPAQDFLPVSGAVDLWQPALGDGLRVDAGIASGSEIPPYYDPMLAKVIAWGENRSIARRRAIDALKNTVLFGSVTNRSFLIDILQHPVFAAGTATTAFIPAHMPAEQRRANIPGTEDAAIAAVLQFTVARDRAFATSRNVAAPLLNWSNGGPLASRFGYRLDGETQTQFLVSVAGPDAYTVSTNDAETDIAVEILSMGVTDAIVRIDGRRQKVHYRASEAGRLQLSIDGRDVTFLNELAYPPAAADDRPGNGRILAPMHGAVLDVTVAPGDRVVIGTRLAVLEAMKMQHDIVADVSGIVKAVPVTAGHQIATDDLIAEIDIAESAGT